MRNHLSRPARRLLLWTAWVVAALLMLPLLDGAAFGVLGVVYAVAFALARNVLVLWPLLTPLGSFFANVEAGDIDLPWASIAGFADVLAVMLVVLWLARRHERGRAALGPSAKMTGRAEAGRGG